MSNYPTVEVLTFPYHRLNVGLLISVSKIGPLEAQAGARITTKTRIVKHTTASFLQFSYACRAASLSLYTILSWCRWNLLWLQPIRLLELYHVTGQGSPFTTWTGRSLARENIFHKKYHFFYNISGYLITFLYPAIRGLICYLCSFYRMKCCTEWYHSVLCTVAIVKSMIFFKVPL